MPAIYMDYQATTPPDPRVVERMRDGHESGQGFANPHSVSHDLGRSAAAEVAASRRSVATLIGADDDEIVFTSGATEANNLAILGTCHDLTDRNEIVVSAIEHKSVLAAARHLESKGFVVRKAHVDAAGRVDMDHLHDLIGSSTRLVSVMATNNEIGVEQDIAPIAALCRNAGCLFHVDAAQALGTFAVDAYEWGADFLSLSSHKVYGPKGIGALFVARDARRHIRSIMFGGDQEDGLRPGTLAPNLCTGFGEACNILASERSDEIVRLVGLRDRFLSKLRERIPAYEINGTLTGRHPANLNIRFPGIEADQMLAMCEGRVAAATGSACTSGIPEPSHVLIALGRTSREANESIRFSFGRFTTAEDIDATVEALSAATALLDGLADA
ncbi:cysteine desulfurase family protein [Jiella sp. M17.18]|uniref:cysteine desulfurase family protein n=1 Tax=Jiella sp. M17.18 TaxID=3234247 RepID=UPI0034DF99FC